MAINSAPGGNVMEGAGVGAGNFQFFSWRHGDYFILGSDNRHRAEQVSNIELFHNSGKQLN